MTAINHALTGAIIGLAIGNPFIAAPAAFLSHFVCDALPHFGPTINDDNWLRSKPFRVMLVVDASLCLLLVLLLALAQPEHWQLASITAFLATSPDLFWLNRYLTIKRGKLWKASLFSKFAANIQWFERPIGALVESAWFIAGILLVRPFLR